jgi:hypothetical protein
MQFKENGNGIGEGAVLINSLSQVVEDVAKVWIGARAKPFLQFRLKVAQTGIQGKYYWPERRYPTVQRDDIRKGLVLILPHHPFQQTIEVVSQGLKRWQVMVGHHINQSEEEMVGSEAAQKVTFVLKTACHGFKKGFHRITQGNYPVARKQKVDVNWGLDRGFPIDMFDREHQDTFSGAKRWSVAYIDHILQHQGI